MYFYYAKNMIPLFFALLKFCSTKQLFISNISFVKKLKLIEKCLYAYFPAKAQKNVYELPRPTEAKYGSLSLRVGAKSVVIAEERCVIH